MDALIKEMLEHEFNGRLFPVFEDFSGSKFTPGLLSLLNREIQSMLGRFCKRHGMVESPKYLLFIYQKDHLGQVVPISPRVDELLPDYVIEWAAAKSDMKVDAYKTYLAHERVYTWERTGHPNFALNIRVFFEDPDQWKLL